MKTALSFSPYIEFAGDVWDKRFRSLETPYSTNDAVLRLCYVVTRDIQRAKDWGRLIHSGWEPVFNAAGQPVERGMPLPRPTN